jgi:hypothetical protein
MSSTETLPNDMDQFIDDFRDDEIRERLGRSLVLLAPGDWGGFIRFAAEHGYVFTAEEIDAAFRRIPQGMARLAEHPVLKGWAGDSLSRYITARGQSRPS